MLYDPKWEVEAPAKELEPWKKSLIEAVKILNDGGWCQHSMRNYGRFCVVGAILHTRSGDLGTAITKVEEAVDHPFGIVGWNDTKGRAKEQVIDMLQSLIKS